MTAAIAVSCFSIRALEFDSIRAYLDSMAGDGSADPYTPYLHQRITQVSFIGGLLFAFAAAVLWFRFQKIASLVKATGKSHRLRCRQTIRQYRALIRNNVLWISLLTILAGMLRLPYLNQPIRYDEATTFLSYVRHPWFIGISLYDDPNNHIFHTLCVRICSQLFGDDLWAIRLPAFLAGFFVIPPTFLSGRLIGGRLAGIFAASIVAGSSVLIEYSSNARGYSIVCLCTMCSLLSVLMLHRRLRQGVTESGLHWHILVAGTSIGLWTIPVMVFPAVLTWTWLFLVGVRSGNRRCDSKSCSRRFLFSWCVAGAVTAIGTTALYMPVLIASGWRSLFQNGYVQSLSWHEFLRRTPDLIVQTASLLLRDCPSLCIVLIIAGVATWAFWSGRNGISGTGVATFFAIATCMGVVFLQRVIPPARVWLFCVPMVAVPAAAGLSRIADRTNSGMQRVLPLFALAIFVAWPAMKLQSENSIAKSSETGVCPDAESIVLTLKDRIETTGGKPVLLIATSPVSAPLVYYARRHGLSDSHFQLPDETSIKRSFVIVTRTKKQSVADVLRELGLNEREADSFQLRDQFPTVEIHQGALVR